MDDHGSDKASLKGPGLREMKQGFVFKNSGKGETAAARSGYIITRRTTEEKGKIFLETSKRGSDVSVQGMAYSAGAGSGSAKQEVQSDPQEDPLKPTGEDKEQEGEEAK
jgi:hypothetical protein